MLHAITGISRNGVFAILGALSLLAAPAGAQVRSVDPDAAIDGDLSGARSTPTDSSVTYSATPVGQTSQAATEQTAAAGNGTPEYGVATTPQGSGGAAAQDGSVTYREDDLIGAAEGVFGKGAKGLASVIEDILAKQGEPNGYIVGREGGGAIAVGLRYGSGTLHHKVEGERPVYWTGPSIGFDAGANAANAFVLVYNLYDTQDLYERFGSGEGQVYFVGGFNVSYLRRGNIVLIPVRVGAGLRLGANIGYMKFSQKQRWMPF